MQYHNNIKNKHIRTVIIDVIYTIKNKDTLNTIGKYYNISPIKLAKYNHLSHFSNLVVGTEIRIPCEQIIFIDK